MELMYGTGVRVSELVGISLDDIDFNGLRLRIRGKGKRNGLYPLLIFILSLYKNTYQLDMKS